MHDRSYPDSGRIGYTVEVRSLLGSLIGYVRSQSVAAPLLTTELCSFAFVDTAYSSERVARRDELSAEVEPRDLRVVEQVRSVAFVLDGPLIEDVPPIGDTEALAGVLFDHEDRRPEFVHRPDIGEDLLDDRGLRTRRSQQVPPRWVRRPFSCLCE